MIQLLSGGTRGSPSRRVLLRRRRIGATFMRIENGQVPEDWDAWALDTLFMA